MAAASIQEGRVVRWLALANDDEAALARAKIDGIRRLLLGFGAARTWIWVALGGAPSAVHVPVAVVLTVCAALAWFRKTAWLAPWIALPLLLVQVASTFPMTDNHFFLEVLCVGLLCSTGRDENDDRLVLQGMGWLTAIILFETGLQKVLYGLYFHGEFLAFMVGRGGRFAALFDYMLPADEVARLAAIDPMRTGAGPFRLSSPVFVALSNLIWIAEMGLAPLLLVRRSRVAAAIAALLLVVAIQLGARELGFALLFGSLLLLFLPIDLVRRLAPVAIAALAWAALAAWGLVPGGTWIGRTL
ncbi:MAG: hypothetical protein FJ144_21445 [Deltaproteobacteria bacterium]|nr:hypothetical protein [Deltaproteobacteria bacterium]